VAKVEKKASAVDKYYSRVTEYISKIYTEERQNIEKAADLMTEQIAQNKVIHAIGPGAHSRIGIEDLFFRAGGLVPINAILEFSMDQGALRSMLLERVPGIATALLDYYKVKKDDLLILINAYGINAATIETALECKKRGTKIIAVTSPVNARAIPENHPARHPSGKNLCDLELDVMIDCKMPVGDAVVELEGLDVKVGPITTVVISYIVNTMVCRTVEKLIEKGIEPPVIVSVNTPDAGRRNQRYFEEYYNVLKRL
jgi:uncharacterized phosphosugar-binding protein